jgi:hypothetical protein
MSQDDFAIRLAAFDAIGRLVAKLGSPLTWSEIATGFIFGGERILFAYRPRGIYKPKQLAAERSVSRHRYPAWGEQLGI